MFKVGDEVRYVGECEEGVPLRIVNALLTIADICVDDNGRHHRVRDADNVTWFVRTHNLKLAEYPESEVG